LSLIKDLQFSLRQLRKAKVFAVVAVVTFALGIGCNTAIFSVFYSVLLRPLPFSDPDRPVIVSERATKFPMLTASWLNCKDWKAPLAEALAIWRKTRTLPATGAFSGNALFRVLLDPANQISRSLGSRGT
jgi:putative ABC transport system permease protein